jgi:hypothetical protein
MDSTEQKEPADRGGTATTLFSLDPSIELSWRQSAKQKSLERAKPIRLELPSGRPILAIRAHVRWLFKHNMIPDTLLAKVEDMIKLIELQDPQSIEKELSQKLEESPETEFLKWLDLINACWLGCVVQPQFTDDPDREGEESPPYYVGDVDYWDKMYLYQWAQGVDQSIIEFFQQQGEVMGALADGDILQLSAEGDLWVDRRGRFVAGPPGGPSDDEIREVHPKPNRRAARSPRTKKKQT